MPGRSSSTLIVWGVGRVWASTPTDEASAAAVSTSATVEVRTRAQCGPGRDRGTRGTRDASREVMKRRTTSRERDVYDANAQHGQNRSGVELDRSETFEDHEAAEPIVEARADD